MEPSFVFSSYVSKGKVRAERDDSESVVRGMAPHMWRALLKLPCPSHWDREDLLQIGLMAALEALPRFDPEKGQLAPFLIRTGVNAMSRAASENNCCVRVPSEARRLQKPAARETLHASRYRLELDGTFESGGAKAETVGSPCGTEDLLAIKVEMERLPSRVRDELLAMVTGEKLEETTSQQARYQRRARALGALKAPKQKTNAPKSGVSGVAWHKATNRWQASLYTGGRRVFLGLYRDVPSAAEAVRRAKASVSEAAE